MKKAPDLTNIEDVRYELLERLAQDDWTISKLATAGINDLISYPGVGKKTARRIIAEAQQILNRQLMQASQRLERTALRARAASPQSRPMAPLIVDEKIRPMSARIARIHKEM